MLSYFTDNRVRMSAMRTLVVAILDQRNHRTLVAKNVISWRDGNFQAGHDFPSFPSDFRALQECLQPRDSPRPVSNNSKRLRPLRRSQTALVRRRLPFRGKHRRPWPPRPSAQNLRATGNADADPWQMPHSTKCRRLKCLQLQPYISETRDESRCTEPSDRRTPGSSRQDKKPAPPALLAYRSSKDSTPMSRAP